MNKLALISLHKYNIQTYLQSLLTSQLKINHAQMHTP